MSLIGLGLYGFLLFVLCFQVVGSFSVIKYSADTLEPLSLWSELHGNEFGICNFERDALDKEIKGAESLVC